MPRLRSVLHSGQGPAAPCSHPTRLETYSGSLTFLLSAPAIRRKRLPDKLVRGNHEHAIRLGVWNIDDPQVSTRCCLAQSNPGTLTASPVLTGFLQDFRDFILVHFMVMNMGRAGHRVDIESGLQASSTLILTRSVIRMARKPPLCPPSSASRRRIVAWQPPAPRMPAPGCALHHTMYPGPKTHAIRMPSTITPVPRPGLLRQIGFFSATALVISNMVGTGIFATTGFMAGDLGSARLILACWGVGALFALAGAVSYSELGINFPSWGGEYVYLTHAFGPEWGFMTGWVSFFAGFSAPIAAAALAFSDYLGYFFPALKQANATLVIGSGAFTLRLGAGQMTASALIAAFTALNCLGVGRTAKVQNVLTATKLIVITGFVILGFAAGTGDWHYFSQNAVRTSTVGLPTQFMISLLWVMVGYSGWKAPTY